jgi:hypothetical protein
VKKPKQRIKKVFEKVLEKHGTGIGEAMLSEGYTKATAKNPKNVTDSKSWEMLLEEYLPDDLLTKVAKEGLEAMKPIGALVLIKNNKEGETEQILKDNEGMIEVADHPTRQRFLETSLKMKGRIVDKSENKETGEIKIRFVDEKYGGDI